jgi:hypothetical protein
VGQDDGSLRASFPQITNNADEHSLMRRFHQPGAEKRALVVPREERWTFWAGVPRFRAGPQLPAALLSRSNENIASANTTACSHADI